MKGINSISSAITFCFKKSISFEQFVFLYLLRDVKQNGNKKMAEYIQNFDRFSVKQVIAPLEKKGYIENMNSPGQYYTDMFLLTPKADEHFATFEMGLEFWETYPGTMPISGGKMFISRSGADMEDIIDMYLNAIDFDLKTHQKVIKSIHVFSSMVNDEVLNGKKIIDYVKERVWDSLPMDHDSPQQSWGKDV